MIIVFFSIVINNCFDISLAKNQSFLKLNYARFPRPAIRLDNKTSSANINFVTKDIFICPHIWLWITGIFEGSSLLYTFYSAFAKYPCSQVPRDGCFKVQLVHSNNSELLTVIQTKPQTGLFQIHNPRLKTVPFFSGAVFYFLRLLLARLKNDKIKPCLRLNQNW